MSQSPQNMEKEKATIAAAHLFKPYIVKRPHGGCQVLFPLTELDDLIERVYLAGEKAMLDKMEKILVDEMNIAHAEGQPTSRLTSVYNKIFLTSPHL